MRQSPSLPWGAAATAAVVAVVVLVVAATAATAVAPRASDWQLTGLWYTFANADDVRAMALDGDALWTATASGGVARWAPGGREYEQYLAPQHGLPCNDVRDVVAWQGRWWFATCAGLAVYNPGRDRMDAVSADLPSPATTALAVDAAGRLWVAMEPWWDPALQLPGKDEPGGWTGGGVAYTRDGASWTAAGVDEGLPSNNVRDLAVWEGAMWLAAEPYLVWRPPEDDPDTGLREGRFDAAGGGVARFDGSAWTAYDSNTSTELSDNARVLAAGEGVLWVGTGGRGLVAHSGGKWKALMDCGDENRCIQDNYVTALAVGGDGAVWVGTARFNGRGTGVNVLDHRGTPGDPGDDAWSVLAAEDGLPAERVHAILPVDADATVWFGVADLDPEDRMHGRGLVHLQGDRRTMVLHASAAVGDGAPAGNDITAVARNVATGELWVGTGGSGVSVRSTEGAWRHYTRASTAAGLGSDDIADIAVEPDGTVWVATRQTTYDATEGRWADGGLSRFDGSGWSLLSGTASGLPSDHLSALALDGRGKLWVGTGATERGPKEHAFRGWGLAVVDTETARWERTFTFPTLTSNNITDIAASGNLIWVATSYFLYIDPRPNGAQVKTGGGISLYDLDAGTWHKIGSDQGLTVALQTGGYGSTSNLIDLRAIWPDPSGGVWAGGLAYPSGLLTAGAVPDGIVDVVGTDAVTTHRFGAAGAVRAVRGDQHGFLWAATEGGGVKVWVGDEWIERGRARGGLPSDNLNVLAFGDGETWLGTASSGLVRLVGVTDGGTVDPALPTLTPPPLVQRLPEHVYLPSLKREALPLRFGPVEPAGPAGPAR